MQCETWKDVVEHSVRNPEVVLQALQDQERFDLVREWIDVYGYPSQLREVGTVHFKKTIHYSIYVCQME